jgi:cytochrome c peroxidase
LLAVLISGCQKSDLKTNTGASISNNDDPDNVKTTAIALAAYRLPDSDDFASIPQDPKNPLTTEKVELGKLLFHESRLRHQQFISARTTNLFLCFLSSCRKLVFNLAWPRAIGEGGIGFGCLR